MGKGPQRPAGHRGVRLHPEPCGKGGGGGGGWGQSPRPRSIPHRPFPSLRITELSSGSSSSTQLPTATLLRAAPATGEDVERVSTGTKFALRRWLASRGEQGGVRPEGSLAPKPPGGE